MIKQDYETIKVDCSADGLAILTLNRPNVRNALNTKMGEELRDIFVPLRFSPEALRCIVITGEGDKAFCAGGDLKERDGMSDETWRKQHSIFEEAMYAVMECPIPVIAAVNGYAYGGGCEMALMCDFIYASSNAKFALTEVSIGIMPGAGGTQNLPRAVGERRAKELILSAGPWSAQEGYEWGLVNRVCEPDDLLVDVTNVAQRICANAPISVRQAKKSIHYGLQVDNMTGLIYEVQCYERMIATDDRREGIRSFNEKRKPKFEGR